MFDNLGADAQYTAEQSCSKVASQLATRAIHSFRIEPTAAWPTAGGAAAGGEGQAAGVAAHPATSATAVADNNR